MQIIHYRQHFRCVFYIALVAISLCASVPKNASAQLPWNEDFDFDFSGACLSQGQAADMYNSFNGHLWTVENILPNNPPANKWYISATEVGGHFPGFNPCGNQCISNNFLGDQTLHIGSQSPMEDIGANYTGFAQGIIFNTDARISSDVNCNGFVITVTFNYIAGVNTSDRCNLEYFDGLVWNDLGILPATGFCPGGEPSWEPFTVILPASANNNPDVKIGFHWTNNSDGVFEEVSVAIDNINIFAGPDPADPIADFEILDGNDAFCENNCATFNDLTTFDPMFSDGAATATYAWTFTGGDIADSDLQNPTVCYPDPGNFSATLVVTDNIGESFPTTVNNIVTVLDCGPEIAISANNLQPCANEECIDFMDLSTTTNPSGISSWLWTFTSTVSSQSFTSNLQNPTNICLNEPGAYDVTLEATDPDGTESLTFSNYITVLDCSGPDIDFSADRLVICPEECIQLTDMSTSNGTIVAWNWEFPGGMPESSTMQNPTVCYTDPGTYNITLSATDQEGPSAITKTIAITVDPCTGPPQVGIGASALEICTFDCVDFVDQSLGLVEDYLWIFQGTSSNATATSTEENPSVICYDTPGTYNVTLTVSNSNGQIDSQTFIDYITVNSCINAPVPRIALSDDTICAGKCINFTDQSTGVGINSWQWSFQGAQITLSSQRNPSNICYNQPGRLMCLYS